MPGSVNAIVSTNTFWNAWLKSEGYSSCNLEGIPPRTNLSEGRPPNWSVAQRRRLQLQVAVLRAFLAGWRLRLTEYRIQAVKFVHILWVTRATEFLQRSLYFWYGAAS